MSLSHLFQTLGLTVLHMLWIGALIGGVAFVWLRSNQAANPRARYACAVGGLMALLVGTGLTFAFLASMSPTPIVFPVDAAGPSTTDDLQLSVETASLQRNFDRGTTGLGRATTSMIAWGWITGIALMSVRLFRQWIRVRRLRVVGIAEPSADWALMFNTLKSKIGIDSRISMLVSHTIDSPMVVGWVRPLVLVPAAAFTSLTPDQLQTVLAHELQHIARRDHLVNMLQAFIEVLLFFHPVTWWLSRQIRVERENCCDDGALLVTGSPRTFAEALLVLESLRSNKNHSPQLLTATGGSLMHRVSRLFGTNQPQPLNAGWRTLSACTLLAAAGLAFTTAAINPAAVAQDRGVVEANQVDLDELKSKIEERVRAMGMDLRKQVAAGEISEADAKARFEEGEKRMWMRYRDAEAKTVGGGNSKADYETAVEKMTEMVKAGKITREQMQQRLDRMKQAGMKKTEDIDLKALKARIEERVLAMGVDLRKQVAAGKISEADAKARFEEGEKKMWMRYRAAEEKAAAAKNDGIDLDELKTKIEERVRAMGVELRKQVAAGEISEADAKARFEEGEKRMWMRYRAAEEKAAAGGKSKADYNAAVEKMTDMVKAGKITREQMQQRLERMKHADD
jgi:beta-lactamase regulating signal transducer with metallopeptidase domain